MVGSAKLGCSLSPKNLFRRFRGAGKKTSDVDIVIVSLRLFSQFWHRLHDKQPPRNTSIYRKFIIPSIFSGYIDGWMLRKLDRVAGEWCQVFSATQKSLQNELRIIHPINFRIYRTWEDFERYHLRGIERLKYQQ
jgi:hypothetical protein